MKKKAKQFVIRSNIRSGQEYGVDYYSVVPLPITVPRPSYSFSGGDITDINKFRRVLDRSELVGVLPVPLP